MATNDWDLGFAMIWKCDGATTVLFDLGTA
jgi:hypothetical protein